MQWFSPGKINLHLRVGPLRDDGFHGLFSWMVRTSLGDDIDVQTTPGGGVELTCDLPGVPTDSTNLIVRAAARLGVSGLRVRLRKRIPMGAGMGGGSSNAATMLRAVVHAAGLTVDERDLMSAAADLGSDVPFFLGPPSALVRGRGEVLEPMPAPRARFALLLLPAMGVATGPCYREFDRQQGGGGGTDGRLEKPADWAKWAEFSAQELLPKLVNDLEPAAFAMVPQLARLRDSAESALGRPVRMSGSGSTLFTLFDDAGSAEAGRAKTLQTLLDTTVATTVVQLAPAALS